MRFMLCTVFILAALLVSNARGQKQESSYEDSYEDNDENNSEINSESSDENNDDNNNTPWWTKLFNSVKKFVKDILALFEEFKAEFEKKTRGVVIWTEEMWAGMKKEMNEWIDSYDYATDEEKNEMRMYIERLEMPKESEDE